MKTLNLIEDEDYWKDDWDISPIDFNAIIYRWGGRVIKNECPNHQEDEANPIDIPIIRYFVFCPNCGRKFQRSL